MDPITAKYVETLQHAWDAALAEGPICELCGRPVEEPTHDGPWPPAPIGVLSPHDRDRVAQLAATDADIEPGCCCSECRNLYLGL